MVKFGEGSLSYAVPFDLLFPVLVSFGLVWMMSSSVYTVNMTDAMSVSDISGCFNEHFLESFTPWQ